MKRTPSELKLREDEELADFRDYVMFRRIVDRISRQQEQIHDLRLRRENDMCLAHVIGIRNGSEDEDHKRFLLSDFVSSEEISWFVDTQPELQRDDEIFVLEF
jgi:hypothetical protein